MLSVLVRLGIKETRYTVNSGRSQENKMAWGKERLQAEVFGITIAGPRDV